MFNLVVVSVASLDGDVFSSLDGFVVSVNSFIGDLFNIGFSLDGLSQLADLGLNV